MDWSKGYSSQYYVSIIDPVTWKDTERVELLSGTVNRSPEGLQESASLVCQNSAIRGEKWVRVYIDTMQGGKSAHTAIFTGLGQSSEVDINGTVEQYPVSCYSVLMPAEDILLQRGWYAPSGANGANLVKELLSVTPAPIVIEGESPLLSDYIIAEDKETNLSMAYKVLESIGWRIRITGDGTITVCPQTDEVVAAFDPQDNDSIEPAVTLNDDWFQCPNVFRVISGNFTAIARDDSIDSPLSTVNRGREVWAEDTSVVLGSNEGLSDYAVRRLKEEQRRGLVVRYTRRYSPDIVVGDRIQLHYPAQGMDGQFVVTSQQIELSYAGKTAEEVNWI